MWRLISVTSATSCTQQAATSPYVLNAYPARRGHSSQTHAFEQDPSTVPVGCVWQEMSKHQQHVLHSARCHLLLCDERVGCMGSAHNLLSVCDPWIWSQQSYSADALLIKKNTGTPYTATSLYAARSLCGDDTAANHMFPQMDPAFARGILHSARRHLRRVPKAQPVFWKGSAARPWPVCVAAGAGQSGAGAALRHKLKAQAAPHLASVATLASSTTHNPEQS